MRASDRPSEPEDEHEERESWWGIHAADRLRAVVATRASERNGDASETPEYLAVELVTRRSDSEETADDHERGKEPIPARD